MPMSVRKKTIDYAAGSYGGASMQYDDQLFLLLLTVFMILGVAMLLAFLF
jgi:hypothetical protein